MAFFEEAYIYEILGWSKDVFSYRFKSEGEHDITKVVSISPVGRIQNVYNLGFGNREQEIDGTVFDNDSAEINNNDFETVLKTVFSCVAHFLIENPSFSIIFYGNAEHKHRTYMKMVVRDIEVLREYFIIEGGSLDNSAPLVEQEQVNVKEGKAVKKKIRVKDPQLVNQVIESAQLKFIEDFDVKNTMNYQFISIRLK